VNADDLTHQQGPTASERETFRAVVVSEADDTYERPVHETRDDWQRFMEEVAG